MSNWKPQPTMECPSCKEIEFEHVDTLAGGKVDVLEYKCGSCGEVGFFDDLLPKVKTIGIAWTKSAAELEKSKQEWWQQQNQDDEWIGRQLDAS